MSRIFGKRGPGIVSAMGALLSSGLVLQGCGIEAGNPSTKKPKGTLNLIFTKTATSTGESMELTLSSIGVSSTDDWLSVDSLPLTKNSLELFSSDGTISETLVQAELTEGSYDQIIINLPTDRVGRYKDNFGKEDDVMPDSSGDGAYYFADTIEIVNAEATDVHINLDPRRSITDDGTYRRFKPIGSMGRGKFRTTYEGNAASGSTVACVYHFNAKKPGRHLERESEGSGNLQLHRGRKSKIESVGVYVTRDEIQFDSSISCPNAFRRVTVVDGKFEILGVPPGDYAVRFFSSDNAYSDGEDFKVE